MDYDISDLENHGHSIIFTSSDVDVRRVEFIVRRCRQVSGEVVLKKC